LHSSLLSYGIGRIVNIRSVRPVIQKTPSCGKGSGKEDGREETTL